LQDQTPLDKQKPSPETDKHKKPSPKTEKHKPSPKTEKQQGTPSHEDSTFPKQGIGNESGVPVPWAVNRHHTERTLPRKGSNKSNQRK
jgi:hypothetical protein